MELIFETGHAGVWVQTHTIYYRPLKEDSNISNKASTSNSSSHSSRKGKGSSSKSVARRKGDLWNGNGNKFYVEHNFIVFQSFQIFQRVLLHQFNHPFFHS